MDGFGAVKQTVLLKKLKLSSGTEPDNERNYHVSITAKAEEVKGEQFYLNFLNI